MRKSASPACLKLGFTQVVTSYLVTGCIKLQANPDLSYCYLYGSTGENTSLWLTQAAEFVVGLFSANSLGMEKIANEICLLNIPQWLLYHFFQFEPLYWIAAVLVPRIVCIFRYWFWQFCRPTAKQYAALLSKDELVYIVIIYRIFQVQVLGVSKPEASCHQNLYRFLNIPFICTFSSLQSVSMTLLRKILIIKWGQ